MSKSANSIDVHVGRRVRGRRLAVNMSQEKLAGKLGITFQQVQKYEKGTNRIGASRLHHIAQILDVSVSYFFEGTGNESKYSKIKEADWITEFLSDPAAHELVKAFIKVQNPVEAMAAEE